MPGSTILKMAEIAKSQVNYHECPHNAQGKCIFSGRVESDKNHTKYGVDFGFNGVAWCCIFGSWCSKQAGALYFGKPYHFASTIAARDHAKKYGRWTTTPTVGAYSMMAHTTTTGHFGFVIYLLRRNGVLIVGTVEGNTNAQGSREGNVVAIRERVASSWDGYILLDETNSPTPEPTPTPIIAEEGDMISQEIPPDGKLHSVCTADPGRGAFNYKRVYFSLACDATIEDPGVRVAYFNDKNEAYKIVEGLHPYARKYGHFLEDGTVMVSVMNPGPGFVTACVEIEKY